MALPPAPATLRKADRLVAHITGGQWRAATVLIGVSASGNAGIRPCHGRDSNLT
jgi:hypothetical protein